MDVVGRPDDERTGSVPDRHIFHVTLQLLSPMPRAATFLGLLLLGSPTTSPVRRPFLWPQVVRLEVNYKFPIASQADVDLPISSSAGETLYRFRCLPDFPSKNGTIAGLGCYLIPANGHDEGLESATLLNDNPEEQRIAHGRGQMWTDFVRGNCASYPEYGAERHFRLRGMKITVRMTDVKFGPNKEFQDSARTVRTIASFELAVNVVPDRDAVSAVSEPISVSPPRWEQPTDPWNAHPDCSAVVPAQIPDEVDRDFLQKHGLAGPFPPVATQQTTHLLSAQNDYSSQFAPLREPMPAAARLFSWAIVGPNGAHIYDFACSGNEASGGPDPRGRVIPRRFYRFGLVCGLFLPDHDFNLLADGIDPYSRMSPAQILPAQLFGDCGRYPEWGKRRVFHLRGMLLSLRFSSPVFTTGDFGHRALVSARMAVRVTPDPSAMSPVAAPPRTIYWGILDTGNPCHWVLVAP
jgi:hypothetical protein